MANEPLRVVVDTNVIVSALVYGGVPGRVWRSAVEGIIRPVTSDILITETLHILRAKFDFSANQLETTRRKLRQTCRVVHLADRLTILSDDADNRVLETAIAGECNYIITGDKELLQLSDYRSIRITTPRSFLTKILDEISEKKSG